MRGWSEVAESFFQLLLSLILARLATLGLKRVCLLSARCDADRKSSVGLAGVHLQLHV